MLFNVSGLVQEGIGATRVYALDADVNLEGASPERVSGEVEFVRTKSGVLVRAHIALAERATCSRCLCPLVEAVTIEFEEEFQSTTDPRTGVQTTTDPDAFVIDEFQSLDLTEAVRQYRELSLAMQPLCRPDCRGLCANCGGDLNAGPCGCESAPVDSRWEGLAALAGVLREGKD